MDSQSPIIPYQMITGNYNQGSGKTLSAVIIPYQMITGNYNTMPSNKPVIMIIPYQVITGNYNLINITTIFKGLYHTK